MSYLFEIVHSFGLNGVTRIAALRQGFEREQLLSISLIFRTHCRQLQDIFAFGQ